MEDGVDTDVVIVVNSFVRVRQLLNVASKCCVIVIELFLVTCFKTYFIHLDGNGPESPTEKMQRNQIFSLALQTSCFVCSEYFFLQNLNPRTSNNTLDMVVHMVPVCLLVLHVVCILAALSHNKSPPPPPHTENWRRNVSF